MKRFFSALVAVIFGVMLFLCLTLGMVSGTAWYVLAQSTTLPIIDHPAPTKPHTATNQVFISDYQIQALLAPIRLSCHDGGVSAQVPFSINWPIPLDLPGKPKGSRFQIVLYPQVNLEWSSPGSHQLTAMINSFGLGSLTLSPRLTTAIWPKVKKDIQLPSGLAWTDSPGIHIDWNRFSPLEGVTVNEVKPVDGGLILTINMTEEHQKTLQQILTSFLKQIDEKTVGQLQNQWPETTHLFKTLGQAKSQLINKIGQAVGKVTFSEGITEALRDGKSLSLDEGDLIYTNDQIHTTKKTFIEILLLDHSFLHLGENCSLYINKVYPKDVATDLAIETGKLRLKVAKMVGRQDFSIKTPQAALGVRGTQFAVLAEPDQTEVLLEEGQLMISAGTKQHSIQAGDMASATLTSLTNHKADQTNTDRLLGGMQYRTANDVLNSDWSHNLLPEIWATIRPLIDEWYQLPRAERQAIVHWLSSALDYHDWQTAFPVTPEMKQLLEEWK